MKRGLSVSLALLVLVQCVAAQLNALIIVGPRAAEPPLDPAFAGHFETVLWPTAFGDGTNRVMSLVSGLDWVGDPTDASFRAATGGHAFVSAYYESLLQRGYLAQRKKWLEGEPVFALSRPVGIGSASPQVLLLAVTDTSDQVTPVAYNGPWPDQGLLVFEADSWTEAEDVATRCTGRALILELPEVNKGAWDSFYLRGRGWPATVAGGLPLDPTTGVAGLVRARNAVRLLLHPERFTWKDAPDSKDVVWKWFPEVRHGGLILLVAGMTMLACIIGFATYSITLEERAPLAATLLTSAGLTPAVLIVLGALERRFGLDNLVPLLILDCLTLGLVLALLHGLVKVVFPGSHPLLACSLLGLGACLAGNATWSYLSGLFGYNAHTFSPEGTGAVVAYLTAVIAFTRRSTVFAAWFGRAVALGVMVWGIYWKAWWAGDVWLAVTLPLLALFAGEGWMRWPWLIILAFIPNGHTNVLKDGIAWYPLGYLTDIRQLGAVNAFDYFAFAVYPGFWALAIILLYVSVFGGNFVANQMRLIVRLDSRMKALPWTAAGLAAMGLFYPALLPSAVFVAFGALIAFFHTAVWSL